MPATRLIFLGPPGSGKGTQAARVAERYGLTALSSGDRLRCEIRDGTPLGRQAAEFVESGRLVPDEIITVVMVDAIRKLAVPGFVLDGFPRTVPQAQVLERGLAAAGRPIQAVVDFQVEDAAIVERIVTRRVCKNCATTYNMRFFPPRVDALCDKCGGEVIQRVDDCEEVVRTRLDTYRRQTAPLVAHYADQGLLRSVDAARAADEVEVAVAAVIESVESE